MNTMLEILGAQRPVETAARKDRERLRLSARRLRAQLRERARAEHALTEIVWSRLC